MAARPVYAVFRRDRSPNVIPVATWRVERAAVEYAKAVERDGQPVVVLGRDEDPDLDEPTAWNEIYRTPA